MDDKIARYIALLMEWNQKKNIVGYKTVAEIEQKLIGINLKAIDMMKLNGEGADIGSGNGSLGILIKIRYPDKRVWFVERNKKKAAFIRCALHQLELGCCEVLAEDLETISSHPEWDWVVARRLNLSDKLLAILWHQIQSNGRIYWITSSANVELLKLRVTSQKVTSMQVDHGYWLAEIAH